MIVQGTLTNGVMVWISPRICRQMPLLTPLSRARKVAVIFSLERHLIYWPSLRALLLEYAGTAVTMSRRPVASLAFVFQHIPSLCYNSLNALPALGGLSSSWLGLREYPVDRFATSYHTYRYLMMVMNHDRTAQFVSHDPFVCRSEWAVPSSHFNHNIKAWSTSSREICQRQIEGDKLR